MAAVAGRVGVTGAADAREPRRVSLVAFTGAGAELARRVASALEAGGRWRVAELAACGSAAEARGLAAAGPVGAWARRRFKADDALVFVGATGIAVRAVAPLVADKRLDPAVVSVDERGSVVVPLLSGHVGGANDLAREVARATGGLAAVSTATDVRGLLAVDEWAAGQGLRLLEWDVAKEVSARLLAGEPVGFASDVPVAGELPAGLVRGAAEVGVLVTRDPSRSPFARTLHLVVPDVTMGVGCRRGAAEQDLARAVDEALAAAGLSGASVARLATIDLKAAEPAVVALSRRRGWELATFSAAELAAVPGEFASSDFVRRTVGVDNVCERAAVAAGGRLVSPKRAGGGVTVAVACADMPVAFPGAEPAAGRAADGGEEPAGQAPAGGEESASDGGPAGERRCGLLSVVGLGPGAADDLTQRARRTIERADLVVGYTVYVDLVREAFPGKRTLATPMRREVERCEAALAEAARGQRVAMVCSGDPGVYGMAGLCLELAEGRRDVEVEVVPGVTAATGGAALLGAPLMHDFAVISLSDLLTPIEKIRARVVAAASSDMVICLYNPSSRERADYLRRACDLVLAYRPARTVCGVVRNVGREGEASEVLTLGELRDRQVDMFSTVFVGSSATRVVDGRMVTPRGYLERGRATGEKDARAAAPSAERDARLAGEKDARAVAPSAGPAAPAAPAPAPLPRVLVFGGTTEGRELVGWLSARGRADVTYCSATPYGGSLVCEGPRVTTVGRPLPEPEIEALLAKGGFACVVDATHPFATSISASVRQAAGARGVPLVRVVREDVPEGPWRLAADADEAARVVDALPGRVLLTTGSKELASFAARVRDFRERAYVRMLPVAASLERASALGLAASHVVAMQGPFSEDLNRALIRELGIGVVVTKASGASGGFWEKVRAARAEGCELVVIDRPGREEGAGLAEAERRLAERFGV
ncbi:MAG: precorrin-3B C(17)-methyltransferase [Olsenella sp.]|jgi:precorrin-6x reductase